MGARSLGVGRLSLPRLPRAPQWRTTRRWLVVALVLAAALAAGYFLWFRDSSLVAVEQVEVVGAEGEPGVEAALVAAADEMTTLNVDQGALEAAVADDPSVLSVSATADFPHGLRITVDSRRPAGFVPGEDAIVAADGVVLELGAEQPEGLPLIDAEDGIPAAGERIEGADLILARVLGAVPEPLQEQTTGAHMDGEHGPVVEIGEGIELRFGDPAQAERKWAAAAAVLADPGLRSAVYIDVTVPTRPVVG
jgi:cell division protein FtsQ